MQGTWVWSLVRELRSHMLHSMVLKKLKKQKCKTTCDFLGQRPSGRDQWAQCRGDSFGWLLRSCFLVTQSSPTSCDPWTTACQASLSCTVSQSLLKFMSTESVMPSKHLRLMLKLCCPPPVLLLQHSIFPSIRVFSNELAVCNRWPKYWSFSFSISLRGELDHFYNNEIQWGT